MPIFNKAPSNNQGTVTPAVVRSRFQQVLDDFDEAYKRMDHAIHIFDTLVHDIEKGKRFIDKFRTDLTKAIEDGGGTVTPDPASIEEQVRAFVAPSMQKVSDDTN